MLAHDARLLRSARDKIRAMIDIIEVECLGNPIHDWSDIEDVMTFEDRLRQILQTYLGVEYRQLFGRIASIIHSKHHGPPWQRKNPEPTVEDLLRLYSLEEIDRMYRQGRIGEETVTQYLRRWNAGPHYTQAVLADGKIRNFDPEKSSVYRHLYAEFGVRS